MLLYSQHFITTSVWLLNNKRNQNWKNFKAQALFKEYLREPQNNMGDQNKDTEEIVASTTTDTAISKQPNSYPDEHKTSQ